MSALTLQPAQLRLLKEILAAPRGRRFCVVGLGVSGRAMAGFLARRGGLVVGVDARADADVQGLAELGVVLQLGGTPQFGDAEAVAISPGVDPRQRLVQQALQQGVPVFGEIELAGQLPARVIAITGTNGKSTTTALCGSLVEGLGRRAFAGGNLGEPIVAWLDENRPVDVAVLELSSYQLETAYTFSPDVGVVLNVTPDHLERYAAIEHYAAAKERLVACVPPSGCVVLNADDPIVRGMAAVARGRVLWFSTQTDRLPGPGAYVEGDTLVSHELGDFGAVTLYHPRLLGRHNRENALAAFLALHGLGLAPQAQDLLRGYESFKGLPHRLELVGEIAGVQYINDSKATNDASAATGLAAMQRPVVLLAGGKDKGGGYGELVRAAQDKSVRGVLAFGAAGELIARAFTDAGLPVQRVDSMADACEAARKQAQRGDVVLLSPACSSFDAFRDYMHRGQAFRQWVQAHEKGGA